MSSSRKGTQQSPAARTRGGGQPGGLHGGRRARGRRQQHRAGPPGARLPRLPLRRHLRVQNMMNVTYITQIGFLETLHLPPGVRLPRLPLCRHLCGSITASSAPSAVRMTEFRWPYQRLLWHNSSTLQTTGLQGVGIQGWIVGGRPVWRTFATFQRHWNATKEWTAMTGAHAERSPRTAARRGRRLHRARAAAASTASVAAPPCSHQHTVSKQVLRADSRVKRVSQR